MEKPKTSDPSKLHYLGSDVFKNAKYSSMFKICYLGDEKCFFSKISNFTIWNRKTHKIDTLNPPIVTKLEMLKVKCFL